MLDCQKETAKKVCGYFSAEKRHLANDVKHFFTLDVLHEEVNVLFIVKGLGETHNVGKDNF